MRVNVVRDGSPYGHPEPQRRISASKDFERDLVAVGSTPAAQVVALADRRPGRDRSRVNWKGVKLFHVERGIEATPDNAVASWGERDMGKPKTLVDFVDWTRANYPGAHGITIFAPGHTRGRTFSAYRNLDFAHATGWDEFLRRWR